jgi:hypothetical protein
MATIRIKSLLRTYSFTLTPTSTPADILRICPETQRRTLLFQGKSLSANQLLQSVGVEEGSTLLLVSGEAKLEGARVLVKWGPKAMSVLCDERMTVAELKDVCNQKQWFRRGSMRLIYHGSELHDSLVVLDCLTDGKAELIMESHPKEPIEDGFSVKVKTLTGKCFPVTINTAMSVGDIKEIISIHEFLPVDAIRLICAGHGLCDDETVEQLRMTTESIIHLVLRLR